MAKLQRNFIKGKMNKSLDERLVPNGEYIDALNVRIGSTELSEIGAVENTKGNSRLTLLNLVAKAKAAPHNLESYPLSNQAKCIGAYEDSANETIYWFVTDPENTGPQDTNKLDLIVSYNTNKSSITYHVISVDDGNGVNTTLNFNSQYLITGVDKIDDLLFFTDNYNQPRVINVTTDYPNPAYQGGLPANPYLDGAGSPGEFAESLLVIKKPPLNSPTFELTDRGLSQNFLEDRFICFAYRYRYADDMYSATSQFTNPAFVPKAFDYNPASYLNEGMVNLFDTAEITYNTGGPLVVGIDLLFKEASNPVIRIIEKLDKADLSGDYQDETYTFSNNKIYSLLDDNEILRLYDNVPLKAKAQTVMGKRLMYGNYIEGYDVSDVDLRYKVDYITQDINIFNLNTSLASGKYDMMATGLTPDKTNCVFKVDFANVVALNGPGLKAGSRIDFTITFTHHSFETTGSATPITQTPATSVNFSYILLQDFNTVQDLLADIDFIKKIGNNSSVQTVVDSCNGSTLTDIFNCSIPISKVDASFLVYTKVGSGISQSVPPQGVFDPGVYSGTVPAPTVTSTQIAIQLPASLYLKDGTAVDFVGEYYSISSALAQFQAISENSSLHSDRDYEVGIMYMDDYNRSTTVLVSPNNIIHIPCSASDTQNILRVEIVPQQLPPVWATRYKFAIKQDKDLYDTIYSDFYFEDPTSGYSYVLLEGENAQKIKDGDRLKIKSGADGVLTNCSFMTVLEKEAQEEKFIQPPIGTLNGDELYIPSGVYMKVKANNFSTNDLFQAVMYRAASVYQYLGFPYNFPILTLPINFTGTDANPQFFDETLSFGDTIKFEFKLNRPGQDGAWNGCTKRIYEFNETYTVSQDYSNFKTWWEGDNIPLTLANGQETIGTQNTAVNVFISPYPPKTLFFPYIDTLANSPTDVPNLGLIRMTYFRFYEDGVGRKFLIIKSGSQVCVDNHGSGVEAKITITKQAKVLIFETPATPAAPDIFYESSVSYPIVDKTPVNPNGYHSGNVQTQTASLPAIIDTEFMNCFTFTNGAESYKIRDSITRNTFGLGNRVSAVLKGEDYREVHRFADITYSGVYGYNVNNLNEFNLGLLNFKVLEPTFGVIQKLFARTTDILTLQEDKISYVLAGKNLLSDAAAGGVITSVPEVLGTQIARIEEYGIGNNPESFAEYGYDKYFTDSRRGVVIQLKGSAYSNEQLNVISDMGMSSWFRDLFLVDPNTQKLGGFDPYMKEYVLSANSILLPGIVKPIKGGVMQNLLIKGVSATTYTVELGEYVGLCTLTYSVQSISGTFQATVTWDGGTVITVPSLSGTTTATFTKTKVLPTTATVSIISTTGSDNDNLDIDIELSLPATTTLNIIQVCISDNNDKAQTIHNEYSWTSGTFVSPLHSNFVSLAEGTTSPLISEYEKTTAFQGGGVMPVDAATVQLISHKYQSDNFAFDSTVNNFAYLRSATLYNNTPADIATLIAAASNVAPSGASGVYTGSFTMPAGSANDNLYLIYDYRKPVSITLCYSNTSADDACCTCGTSGTYYLDAPTLADATAVYTSAAMTTKATDGWYAESGFYRKQTSGVLEITKLCSACKLSCGTTLSMDTDPGYYTVEVELGAATGAVVVDIDFKTYPDGVKIVYNGTTYNDIYSPNFGFINSPGTHPAYLGITAFDCSISGTTFLLDNYSFNGTGFNATGAIQSVTVDPTSVFLKASGLGTCKMIIPKTAASPSTATLTIIGPCDKVDIDITVACPAALTAFTTTLAAPEATNIVGLCVSVTPTSFYNVPVGGTAGNPGLGDIIYQDANGATLAASGFYGVVGYPALTGVIQVDANGTVSAIVACI